MDVQPHEISLDFEAHNQGLTTTPESTHSQAPSRSRPKSSLRLRYEAEVALIKRKLGSLEDMRRQLGLPQRKLCQLLLVDPSAWTRWNREGEDAPPHIYRMLQWYLALQDKYPALEPGFWLQTIARTKEPLEDTLRTQKIEELKREVEVLREEMANQRSLPTDKDEKLALFSPAWWRLVAWPLGAALLVGFSIGLLISAI